MCHGCLFPNTQSFVIIFTPLWSCLLIEEELFVNRSMTINLRTQTFGTAPQNQYKRRGLDNEIVKKIGVDSLKQ